MLATKQEFSQQKRESHSCTSFLCEVSKNISSLSSFYISQAEARAPRENTLCMLPLAFSPSLRCTSHHHSLVPSSPQKVRRREALQSASSSRRQSDADVEKKHRRLNRRRLSRVFSTQRDVSPLFFPREEEKKIEEYRRNKFSNL